MSIEIFIDKTTVYVGETVTCTTSGTTSIVAYTYFIIDFSNEDMDKSIRELSSEGKVFLTYDRNSSVSAVITEAHKSISTLTPIVIYTDRTDWVGNILNSPLNQLESSQIYYGDIFEMSILENEDNASKYYVSITRNPVVGLDSVSVEISSDENDNSSDNFSIVSSSDYTDLANTLEDIRENNTENFIRPQLNTLIEEFRSGSEPLPSAIDCQNIRGASGTLDYDDLQSNIELTYTKLGASSTDAIDYPTQTTDSDYCSECWSEDSGEGSGYVITDTRISNENVSLYKYVNPSSSPIRMTVRMVENVNNVYIHTDRVEILQRPSAHLMNENESYVYTVEPNGELYLYPLGTCTFFYTVEIISRQQINSIANIVYPVGAIYLSLSNRNPQDLWGGKWERLTDRFLIGISEDEVNYKKDHPGGNSTVTLSESQLPSHTHTQKAHTHIQNSHTHTQSSHNHSTSTDRKFLAVGKNDNWMYTSARTMSYTKGSNYYPYSNKNTNGLTEPSTTASANATINGATASNQSTTAENNYTGGGQPITIMPPYLPVYMWRRVE